MTKEQKIKAEKEIGFADEGAGSYLYCSLWEMMEDREVTVEDYHNQTDAWKRAVRDSLCEPYDYTTYDAIWQEIIWTAHRETECVRKQAKETSENIRTFLLAKIEKFLDKSVTEYSDHLKDGMKTKQSVLLHCLLTSGHELSIRDMDFDNLITDGLVFNTSGQIEQDASQEELAP